MIVVDWDEAWNVRVGDRVRGRGIGTVVDLHRDRASGYVTYDNPQLNRGERLIAGRRVLCVRQPVDHLQRL